MTRVCAPVDDTKLAQIDTDVKEKSISRAQWLNLAIDTYLARDDTDLAQLRNDLTQARTEREQSWRESIQLRREKEHLDTELTQERHKVVSLESSVADLIRHKEEHERLKVAYEKTLEAMKVKDDEIAFLRGHVAQLTQSISQLSLKPGEEEIKKKGWWLFWRRD
jgi:chromosome segregation ATPase